MSAVPSTKESLNVLDSREPAEPRVAIVLVNWNGWRECIECIDSVFAQHHRNFHVFVVDNGSSDSSVDHIVSWCRAPHADTVWRNHPGVCRLTDRATVGTVEIRVTERPAHALPAAPQGRQMTIIRSGANLGFAGGCNVGIVAAGLRNFDYFWLLNPDTVVHQGALIELIRRAGGQPNIGMVGSTLRYYDRPEVVQAMGGARFNRSNGTSAHIGQGANVKDVPTDQAAVNAN